MLLWLCSALLLACDHERVVLGGHGAGGSRSPADEVYPPPAPAAPPTAGRRPPELDAGSLLVPTTPPTAARPAPFAGVTSRTAMTPPIQGGTLAVAADGSIAVASDPDRDLVFVVGPRGSSVRNVKLPEGSEPGRVVLDTMGHAHVVLRGSHKLARIDLNSLQLELSEPLCQHPRGVAYAEDTKSLHVACADGQLLQLSALDYKELARESRERDLRDVIVNNAGKRVVSHFRSAELESLAPSQEVKLNAPVLPWPALSEDASGVVLNVVNTAPTFAFRIQSNSADSVWMLHERAQLDPLDAAGTYSGKDTGCGPVVQPALSLFELSGKPPTRMDLQLQGVTAPAIDFALSARGTYIAIVAPGGYAVGRATLLVQDVALLQKQTTIDRKPTLDGEFPGNTVDLCNLPSFIALESSSQAVAAAFDQNGYLYVQTRYPSRLNQYELGPADAGSSTTVTVSLNTSTVLANDEQRDLGHEWFHAALGTSQLSCAACHAEGLDDGRTWMSGTSARRTPALRGGIKNTAPFFWDGQMASFDDVVTQTLIHQVSAPNLSEAASNALFGWLDRLPALSMQTDDPAAVRGKELFASRELGCTSCHYGPQLTNNLSVDPNVASEIDDASVNSVLGGIQVPSLLGLALRAPYMHDGCAPDLAALFVDATCARPVHAKLAAMSGEEVADLSAYLLSL